MTRHIPFYLQLLLLTCLLSACGEYLDFGQEEELAPMQMTMSHHELILMVGDSLRLSATFSPDDGKEHNVFWISDSAELATFSADTLIGMKPGSVKVRCTSVSQVLTDSCSVNVIPQWADSVSIYDNLYDMVVYATVSVDGVANSDRFVIGAFIDNKICGVGKLRRYGNTPYWEIRIYSDRDTDIEGEPLTVRFRCYERGKGGIVDFSQTVEFDLATHGTITDLFELKK